MRYRIKLLNKLDSKTAVKVSVILFLGLLMALVAFIVEESRDPGSVGTLKKGSYDQMREETLEVKEGTGKSFPITIPIPGKTYTPKEIGKMFKKAKAEMEQYILGKNESLEHVDQKMELLTLVPETPIQVNWISNRPDILNWQGEIQEDVSKKGSLVRLDAQLIYQEQVEEYSCQVTVYPKMLSEREIQEKAILDAVEKANRDQTSQEYVLPAKVNGERLRWYESGPRISLIIAGGAVFAAIMLLLYQEQKKREAEELRKQMMQKDYPHILSKCTLLLNAGMSMRKVFEKIALDYQKEKRLKKGSKGVMQYGYEELLKTYYEMEKGISEQEAYERLGMRSGLSQYKTFSMLLVQNIKKGNQNLMDIMERESLSAFEERKRQAKILGEKAGTKLLLPMGAMLVLVLVILMVPAFLSI